MASRLGAAWLQAEGREFASEHAGGRRRKVCRVPVVFDSIRKCEPGDDERHSDERRHLSGEENISMLSLEHARKESPAEDLGGRDVGLDIQQDRVGAHTAALSKQCV